MKNLFPVVFVAVVLSATNCSLRAQNYDTNNVNVSTYAGFGIPAYVDGQGILTAFNNPTLIVSDTASNLYVWDSGNQRIRKITPDHAVTTFVGGGSFLEGTTTNVSLAWGQINAMAMDRANRIWLVLSSSYFNGLTYLLTVTTNGLVQFVNGGFTNLTGSSSICFDSANNLYYSGGNRIYRYSPNNNTIQPFAGSGISGYFDGQGTLLTAFSSPGVLACDAADNIYVWDAGNSRIRRVDQLQNITTVAGNSSYYSFGDGTGTNASLSSINMIFFDPAQNLYLVSSGAVRKMDSQTVVNTLAGQFYSGSQFADGAGSNARFNYAYGGCFAQGMVFVADSGNNRIRNITFNSPGQVVTAANLELNTYPGLRITGAVGRTYQIQSSSKLTNWVNVATVVLTTSPYLWIDPSPIAGNKFYRAILQP
jgi:hypothetical protein